MSLTKIERAFLEPKNTTHRQYEALRAYFVDKVPSAEAAAKFGYKPGSFRVLCHQFRRDLDRAFFLQSGSQDVATRTKESRRRDRVRETVITLRKQNISFYDICMALETEGNKRSSVGVWKILDQEGFARLPRRKDDERPISIDP